MTPEEREWREWMRGDQWTPEQIAEVEAIATTQMGKFRALKLNRIKTANEIIDESDPDLWGLTSLMPPDSIGHPVVFNPIDYGVVSIEACTNIEVPRKRSRLARLGRRVWPRVELGMLDFAITLIIIWMVLFFALV